MRSATALVRGLGPLRRPLVGAVGTGIYAIDRRRRERTVANHMRRRPDLAPTEARRLARRSYAEYARTTVDFLWANAMDPGEVRRRSRIDGDEHLEAAVAGGRGAVVALAHYGNWDMAALIALARGLRLATVMAPIGPPAITGLVVWARERNAMEVFTPDRAARGLVRALSEGRFVALLCDIPGGGPVCTVQYCGGPVEFSTVPAWLGSRHGAPILPVACRRAGRGDPEYVVEVLPPVEAGRHERPAVIMQRLAGCLETLVDRDPGQWYPFSTVYTEAAGDAGS